MPGVICRTTVALVIVFIAFLPSLITGSGEFTEIPVSQGVSVGETAEFRCRHSMADIIRWIVNDSLISRRNDNSDIYSVHTEEDNTDVLTISPFQVDRFNVVCVARFDDPSLTQQNTTVVFLTGHLDDVKDLKKQNSTLSWKAPFSLNLTNVEPDIAYCVEVYNITCGGRELLISDCDVTETSYTSDVIAPDGYMFEYIVTPRSNVEGAINGTPSQPLSINLPTFTESSTSLSVGNFGHDSNVRAYQTVLKYTFYDPIPSSYSLSLHSLDGLEDMDHVETTATIEPSVLTLEVVSGLPFRRLWNCTVLAYGCQENIILIDVLSTHDFQDILSSSLHPGEVRVTGSFTDDSTATGILVIVIGDSEVIYHKASRDGTDKIKETLITGLAGGEYSISVFVVEENGLPFERVATSPKLVAVESNDIVTPRSSSIEYSLQSTSTGVCITCTFLDSSATDCVAVVHQRISQLSSSGLMNIESSHMFNRTGDTASGCIEGINMEDYQVGVVGGRQVVIVSEKSSCDVCVSVGSVTVVLLLTLVVSVLIVLVCKRSQQKRNWNSMIPMLRVSPTTNNDGHDTERGHGNEYEKCPLDKKEEITDQIDSESTPPPLYSEVVPPEVESESTIGHQQTSTPGVPQRAHTVDRSQPVYAETLSTRVNAVAAPPMVERTEYDQVTGFKTPGGLLYAIVDRTTKPQNTLLDNDIRDRVVYSELKPQVSKDVVVDDSNEKDNHPQLAIDTPFTSSNLLSLLCPVVSKWRELAEALSVDEDDIDEIFTNNETDEACLCDLLDRFITVHHNWVDVERALRKMGEEHLAERASQLYVLPNSVQPEMTEHLGPKVIVHNSLCQPEVESSQEFPAYRTEDNVNRNTSDSNSVLQINDTSTSLAGLMSKPADSGYGSGHSSEEAVGDSDPLRNSSLAHDQPSCSVTNSPPNKCQQIFHSQYGTEESQQMNTQSVQRPHMCTDEHDDNPYMIVVLSTLSVSHHLQMPKEEQQRLSHCKPVAQECLWKAKASVLAQDDSEGCGLCQCQTVSVVNFVGGLRKPLTILRVSVVNRAHHLLEWLSGVHISPISIFSSACIGQSWLPYYQASVFKFASNLPVKLSRLMMKIYCTKF